MKSDIIYDLMDLLWIVFIMSVPFLGFAAVFYFWRREEKLAGAAILSVSLAFLYRLHFDLMLMGWILGEQFEESFVAGKAGQLYIYIGDVFTSLMVIFLPLLVIYVPYAVLKKHYGYAAIALILFLPAYVSQIESYFAFYPLIDTTKSEQFTLRRFDAIRPGMTRKEVRKLIGEPIENAGSYNSSCEGQTGDNAAGKYWLDFAWLDSSVCYDESDRVISTKKMWVPD